MPKLSPTRLERLEIESQTEFLDKEYSKIPLRQRLWHCEQKNFQILKCITCDQKPRRWDRARSDYGKFCSSKCAHNHNSVKEKTKSTCFKKYGATSNLNSDQGKQLTKIKLLEKYGVTHPSHSQEIRDRTCRTNLLRYGVETSLRSKQAIEKTVETNLMKYGYKHHWQSPEIIKKIKKTNLEKYGVENPSQNEKIQEKKTQKLLKNKGISNISQIHFTEYAKKILFDENQFKEFSKKFSLMEAADILCVDRTTIMNYAIKYHCVELFVNDSYLEREMKEFLLSCNIDFIQNCRQTIPGYELDFFLPNYNVAIEMNGNFWHSDRYRVSRYHQNKWLSCINRAIHLIQINESDWCYRKTQIKSLIHSRLSLKQRGDPARKCQILKIDSKQAKKFLENYHLQGFVAGSSHWGAYDSNNHLVGVMTFSWTRGSRQSRRFELRRWAMDENSHAGLFSKTFKTAQKSLKFDQVVSFSQNDWFDGNVYNECGFKKISVTRPGYFYVLNNVRYHPSHFTKSRIKKFFPDIYSDDLTEKQMMSAVGAHRIWDSGRTEWIWMNHQN